MPDRYLPQHILTRNAASECVFCAAPHTQVVAIYTCTTHSDNEEAERSSSTAPSSTPMMHHTHYSCSSSDTACSSSGSVSDASSKQNTNLHAREGHADIIETVEIVEFVRFSTTHAQTVSNLWEPVRCK